MATIRGALRYGTCGKLHVVRIGMGQGEYQSHKFPCRGCKEQIGVGLKVDYTNVSTQILAEENAELAKEEAGVAIVNLNANFLIPEDQQGVDRAFPHLEQQHSLVSNAIERATKAGIDLEKRAVPPGHRPDFAEEWLLLRRAWSLERNGQSTFSGARVRDGSKLLYSDESLRDLPDWLWRFARTLNQPLYEIPFRNVMEALKPLYNTGAFKELMTHYDVNLSSKRGGRYFRIVNDYFNAYSEFSQVQLLVLGGLEIPSDHKASSIDFTRTGMFYGNAFEVLADSVDLLAFLNNLLQGRSFGVFEELTLKKYYELDKAARFAPFAGNAALAALTTESSNQLRNASHHGGIEFDIDAQILRYRVGKGGQGAVQEMSYTDYLTRCVRIFQQILTIIRIELIFSNQFDVRPPL